MTGQGVEKQTQFVQTSRGRIMAMDSAYDVAPGNRDRDVVVNASYCGVLPARFIAEQRPRAAIGVDCGIGPEGASRAVTLTLTLTLTQTLTLTHYNLSPPKHYP